MAEIQPQQVALGAIFEYPDPLFSESELWQVIQEHDADYERISEDQRSRGGVFIGGDGPQIGELGDATFARKDQYSILFQPNGNISPIGECSFVTIRNEEGSFEPMKNESQIFDELLERFDMYDQLLFYEITVNGVVRVRTDETLTRFYSSEVIDTVESITGENSEGSAVIIDSVMDGDEEGWYRILLDKFSIENPRKWRLKYNRRISDKSQLIGGTEEIIERLVEISEQEDLG